MKMPITAAKKSPMDGTAAGTRGAGVRRGWAATNAAGAGRAGSVENVVGTEVVDEEPSRDAAARANTVGAKNVEGPVLAGWSASEAAPSPTVVKAAPYLAFADDRSAAARSPFGVAIAAKTTLCGSCIGQLAT